MQKNEVKYFLKYLFGGPKREAKSFMNNFKHPKFWLQLTLLLAVAEAYLNWKLEGRVAWSFGFIFTFIVLLIFTSIWKVYDDGHWKHEMRKDLRRQYFKK